jgi:saccharopine dehydrogenase (NAD+, L-lysine-forming)
MPGCARIWLRREAAPNEQRAPLTPADAGTLIAKGMRVTVEHSEQRVFPIAEYAAAGCQIVLGDSWPEAPTGEIILGLKEPASRPFPLTHRHVFFGHAYKGQEGGPALLRRFTSGGGTLLDLESLTDEAGHRLTAFGFWAGYVGAAIAVLHHCGELQAPLTSMTRPELDGRLRGTRPEARTLVIGALGRSGRGACAALAVAGPRVTQWDVDETKDLDRSSLLDHDILVNAVLATEPGTPFLTDDDLGACDRRLAVVCDVSCDVTSECNRLPVNDKVTDWREPVRRLHAGPPPLDLIAIDNLPSLLPGESSTAFSADLLPYLETLPGENPIWQRCEERFRYAIDEVPIG